MAIGDVGRLIGARYRVDRELARGHHTESLLVTDLRNGRACVLRQLSLAAASPAEARRFEAQAVILARLDHPGLPRFIDGFFEGEGAGRRRVLVASYHPGESLERLVVKGRPLSEGQAISLLRRLVPVLEYLHAFEPPLVHRTIRASGIIVGPDSRPCLTDLDYALAEDAPPPAELPQPVPDEFALRPPEVFTGGVIPATDIHALGLAIMHGMTEENPAFLLSDGTRQRLRLALRASEAFVAVLVRMVEPSLERRYPDAGALNADLARLAGVRVAVVQAPPRTAPGAAVPPPRVVQQAREPEEPSPRRSARFPALAAIVLALVALAAAAVWMRQRQQPEPPLLAPAVEPTRDGASGTPAQPAPPAEPRADAAPQQPAPAAPAAESAAPADASASPAGAPAPSPGSEPAVPSPALAAPAVAPPAAPPAASVEGRLLFDGKPFARADAPAPQFWFRDEAAKVMVKPEVETAAGTFAVRGLPPGRYGMSVRVNLNPANPNIFPGDLSAWTEFTLQEAARLTLEVPLRTVLHLVQPVDNGAVIPGWDVPCGAGNVVPPQTIFAWEPLGPGVSYEASVDRLACGRGYASAGRVFTQATGDSWAKVDLPPSREGECYSFRLTARREGRVVGIMATHGKAGLGWDHRFTVAGR